MQKQNQIRLAVDKGAISFHITLENIEERKKKDWPAGFQLNAAF